MVEIEPIKETDDQDTDLALSWSDWLSFWCTIFCSIVWSGVYKQPLARHTELRMIAMRIGRWGPGLYRTISEPHMWRCSVVYNPGLGTRSCRMPCSCMELKTPAKDCIFLSRYLDSPTTARFVTWTAGRTNTSQGSGSFLLYVLLVSTIYKPTGRMASRYFLTMAVKYAGNLGHVPTSRDRFWASCLLSLCVPLESEERSRSVLTEVSPGRDGEGCNLSSSANEKRICQKPT